MSKTSKNISKLMVLGPRYHINGQKGGLVASYELFLKELDEKKIEYIAIDTNKKNNKNAVIATILIFLQILLQILKVDKIMLHGTVKDFIYIAPFVVLISKFFKKNFYLKKFAGNFQEVYEESNFIIRKLIKYVLRSSKINFFETKFLVNYFRQFNHNTFYFPNVRRQNFKFKETQFKKKIIFLGHIRKEKGIKELIEAANKLSCKYTVDFYGSVFDQFLLEEIKNSNASYKGILEYEHIASKLLEYDILVLPSYKEGYPGVIIEAFSVGLPVIATNLESIKEMVIDGKNGLLVPSKDSNALCLAIQSFNEINYKIFSKEALKSFDQFNSRKVTNKVLEKIYES